jgi:hypothetical protein
MQFCDTAQRGRNPTLSLLDQYLFSGVELVALRRVAPRAAAQRLPANRSVRPNRSAVERGGLSQRDTRYR